MTEFLVLCAIALSYFFWSKTMATLAEATADLVALTEQVERNRQEVLAKIAELEAAAGPLTTSPEFDAALVALKSKVQESDDDVPSA